MGRVFLADDEIRSELVALKELAPTHHSSRNARLRFENEYRLMAKFRHPNTLQVHDFGYTTDRVPFFTMEYVDGITLSECRPLSIEQVANILGQICHGLLHIHSRLYVHKDLKPRNIKQKTDGSIKLLDYGLMSQLGLGGSRKAAGTFRYMAPEAMTGGVVDAATDMYSLGVIAFELLTGRCPFSGDREELVRAHLKDAPQTPSELRRDVPPSMDKLVLKLLAKEQSERYQSGAEVLEDLRHLIPDLPLAGSVEQRQAYLYSTELVGREAEMRRFGEALTKLEAKSSATLFFGAPSGTGKSRLLHEIKTQCSIAGHPTLWVDEHVSDRPLSWVDELTRQLSAFSTPNEIQRYGYPLSTLLPGLRSQLATRSDNPGEMPEQMLDEAKLERTLRHWVRKTSERTPLVLLLDNLQWMDLKSIAVLNELIRDQKNNRLLIVGSYRSDETSRTFPLFHTRDEQLSTFVELAPLTRAECRALLNDLLRPTVVSEDFEKQLFALSGGNVFELIETLRFLLVKGRIVRSKERWVEPTDLARQPLPSHSSERIILRYESLGPVAQQLANAAAILGTELDIGIWRDVCDVSSDAFYEALDELVLAQLIVQEDEQYFFGHAKLRDALHRAMSRDQHNALHSKAAHALKALEEERPDLVPAIATHFVKANETPAAIDYSLRAAEQTEAAGAEWSAFDHYREAARLLEEHADYPRRDELLLQIYEKAAQFSSAAWTDAPTCLRWLDAVIAHYADSDDKDKVFGLSLAYVVTSCITSNYTAARNKAEQMIADKMVEPGGLGWAVLHGAAICLIDWYQGFQADCLAHAEESVAIFSKLEDDLDTDSWMAYSWAIFWREKARAYQGLPLKMENIELNHERIGQGRCDDTIFWHTLTAVGARAAFSGRWRDLLAWKDRVSARSLQMGKIYWFECWISHSYLYGAIQHGELAPLDQHVAQVRESPDPYQVRLASLFSGVLALERDEPAAACNALEEFLRLQKQCPDNSLLEGYLYLARALMALDKLDEANKQVRTGAELAERGPYANPLYQLQYARLEADLLVAMANTDDAPELAQADKLLKKAATLAHEMLNPLQSGYVQLSFAQLDLKRGNPECALARLKVARELFTTIRNNYRMAKVEALIDSLSLDARLANPRDLATELSDLPPDFDEMEAPTMVVDTLARSASSTWKSESEPSNE